MEVIAETNALQNAEQLSLSIDLIQLLHWIVEHDQEGLKRLIDRALSHGLGEHIGHVGIIDEAEVKNTIVDFFTLVEIQLAESMRKLMIKKTLQRNLMPEVSNIDMADMDPKTVQSSIERATARITANPQENARDVLIRELLRQWKPDKKSVRN